MSDVVEEKNIIIPMTAFFKYVGSPDQWQGCSATFQSVIKNVALLAMIPDRINLPTKGTVVIAFRYDIIDKSSITTPEEVLLNCKVANQSAQYDWKDVGLSGVMTFTKNDEIGIGYMAYSYSGYGMGFWSGDYPVEFLVPILVGENDYSKPSNFTWQRLEEYFDSLPRDKKPFEKENSTTGGGDGLLTEENDENKLDDIILINGNSILRTWFVTQYQLTLNQLQSVAQVFWSDDFITNVKKFFNEPMESIINLSMLPIPANDGTQKVVIGSYDTGISGGIVYNQFKEVNCGDIEVKEFWGSALDYSPHTEIEIFLPFIGIQSIKADDIMKSTINITYRIDTLTGTCTAYLTRTKDGVKNILYQWQGNCSYVMPVTSTNYSSFINGLIQATVTVGSAVASGGTSAMIPIMAGSSLATSSKPHIMKSGNLVCASGFMGYKTPYLILNRPCQSLPNDFEKFRGFQSNITTSLKKIKGFTKVKEIHLECASATDYEKQEIEKLLKDGVIF